MTIIQRYIDLCLMKVGPESIPASTSLLKLTLFAYLAIGIATSSIDMSLPMSIFSSLADTLFMVASIALLLRARGLQVRVQQTLSAMAGAGCCLGIVGFPIIAWFSQTPETEQANSYAMLFMVIIMFWSLMVTSHIFRYALDIKVFTAMMITIIYTALSLLVLGLTMSGVA